MKIYHSTIFLLAFFFLALVGTKEGYAQESGSPSFESYDSEVTNGSEKVVTMPRESSEPNKPVMKTNGHPVLQLDNTDSVVVRFQASPSRTTPGQQKSQAKPKEEDDSILSFNFLYYLIERYKLQDIMD
jgi:hypothetical protein